MFLLEKKLAKKDKVILLERLKERFLNYKERHPKIEWEDVLKRLEKQPERLKALAEMEKTGGEPDIVGTDYIFIDCAPESPKGRRRVCYDRKALEERKKFKPENDAKTFAQEMGIELLTEEEYRDLQSYGEFDLKTSSWLETPEKIRELGGAIFGDRRYDTTFIYHNGADSYYSSRGFRGKLKI